MKAQRQLPLGGKQEPTMSKVLEAKGGKSEAIKRQADKIEALCAEIYRLTGQKVTADDPILLAALFQSELINKAGENAAALFQDTVAKSVAQLADAVKAEREQAANLDKTVATAFQQIADGAKKAGDQELATMQGRFARMASETLDQVRRESARRAPGGLWWKLAAMLCSGLAAGLIGGVVLGKGMAPKLSDNQVRLMHNGMLLDEAWPKLPKATREAFQVPPRASDTHLDEKSAAKAGKK
jgi:hypothetical protein